MVLRRLWEQVADGFRSVKGSPRELWLVLVLDLLESFNYFSVSLLFTLYLSGEFGVSDFEAGTLYGLWGSLLVAYGILFSGIIDILGVKQSLVICYVINIICRYVIAATHSKDVLLWVLLGPLSVAGSLGTPVQTIAIKRYTTDRSRAFAFSLFYSFMNIAGLSCASTLDFFRVRHKHGFNIPSLPANHVLNDGSRLLLLVGVFTSTAALVISLCMREGAVVRQRAPTEEDGGRAGQPVVPITEDEAKPLLKDGRGSSLGGSSVASEELEKAGTAAEDSVERRRLPWSGQRWKVAWADLKEVVACRETWKFLVVCVILVNLRQIFRHLDATLPKYLIRMYGCNAPVGFIYGINPLMIIFMVPVVGAVTSHLPHFDVIHWGGYISALSPFWMVFFPQVWGAVLFVVFLSLGESVWSPRWYAFSMEMAPEGKEGIFTALASAPLFAAKLPTGMLSGKLLQEYCPDTAPCIDGGPPGGGGTGTCDGKSLWTVIGLVTLSSPLLMLILQRWIRPTPKPVPSPLERGHSASSSRRRSVLGEPDTSLAVPVHDILEDEAPAEAMLQISEDLRDRRQQLQI